MKFQEILDNNPYAFVSDNYLCRDVYDVINRRIVGEDRRSGILVNTVCAIPKQYTDIVAALMTSTTPFYKGYDNLTFYARSQLWICTNTHLTSMQLIPDQYRSYFDEFPLRVHIKSLFAYMHQWRNVLLIKRYEDVTYDTPNHMLIIFPATFTITSTSGDGYDQPFLVHDSTIQQTYRCWIMYSPGHPIDKYLKITVATYPGIGRRVDLGLRIITD